MYSCKALIRLEQEVSKHSQMSFHHIPFLYIFPYYSGVFICTIRSPYYYSYRQINYYLVMLIPSMLPCNYSHMSVTCSKDQDIMYINLKSTFTKIDCHAIINSQSLIIILQLAPTYSQVHISCPNAYCDSKIILKQDNYFMQYYRHIHI